MFHLDTNPQEVLHFPSSLVFPLTISPSMPSKKYTSSRNEVKTAIHWGQRKLLLSEIELLTLYCTPGKSYWFVYAGAAPCTHMKCLDRMYRRVSHKYELIDPSPFDEDLSNKGNYPNLTLRNEFFTNRVAYGIAAQRMKRCPGLRFVYESLTVIPLGAQPEGECVIVGDQKEAHNTGGIPSIYEAPLELPHGLSALCYALAEDVPTVFLSDIRSGSLQTSDDFEEDVMDNMKAQAVWHRIIRPEFSMLKFRLPYMEYEVPKTGERKTHPSAHTSYPAGDVLLPIWTRPTSSECRLVCRGYAPDYAFDNRLFEDQCHYFNMTLRTKVHFNHPVLLNDADLDHKYDGTAEVQILAAHQAWESTPWDDFHAAGGSLPCGESRMVWLLQRMTFLGSLRRIYSEALLNAHTITVELKRTFQASIVKRDEIMLAKAREKGWEGRCRELMRRAVEERERPIWWKNVPETEGMLREAKPWEYVKLRQ